MQESEFVRVRLEVGRRFEIVEHEAAILGIFWTILLVDVAEWIPRMKCLAVLAVFFLAYMAFPAISFVYLDKTLILSKY